MDCNPCMKHKVVRKAVRMFAEAAMAKLYCSATAAKKNLVLTGVPKRIVEQLFERFDDKLGGAIGKDLKTGKRS